VLSEISGLAGRTGITFAGDSGTRQRLSYDALGRLARTAAARLRRHGVTEGSLVAMTLLNDLESVAGMLGTWAAGATVVSVPPPPRSGREVYRSQFRTVLDAMGCEFMLQPGGGAAPVDPSMTHIASPSLLAEGGPQYLAEVAPRHALVQFTSGSIAAPKGVAITGATLADHLRAICAIFDYGRAGDRVLSWLPLYHDMGLLALALAPLVARLDLVLATPQSFILNPASWMTGLSAERATITGAPDFAFRVASRVPYPGGLDLSAVRLCLSGGERVNWQSLVDLHAAVERHGFRWRALSPSYGLAEATVGVTVTPPDCEPRRGPHGQTSVGRPFPGVEIHAPAGPPPGPIRLRSPWLLDGYFTRDGFERHEAELLDTGDAGFLADGDLYVNGRVAEMISAAGRNIYAEDIEAIAYHAGGPRLRGCAAFRSAEGTRFGLLLEAGPQVAGRDAVTLGQQVRSEVSAALGVRLAHTIVATSRTIPRTTSGKVQRSRAREAYETGTLDPNVLAVIE
jgi:fatty-acyl-CoA synthase